MKKFLSILAIAGVFVFVFGLISKKTGANPPVFNEGSKDELDQAREMSLDILRQRSAQRAIGNVDDFQVQKVEIDELKMAHTRVRQTVGGIPVWEGEAIVHLNQDGSLASVTDDLKEALAVGTEASLSVKQAVGIVENAYQGSAKATDAATVDQWIFRSNLRDHLAYRVLIPRIDGSEETSALVTFVDAQSGEILLQYDNLQTGTGPSRYSGNVTINTTVSGATYYMEDTTRRMGTFNMNSTGNESTGTGGTQSRFTDTDDIWNTAIQQAGVDAHYGAAKTFDYYQTVHGRNGIDGNYGPGTTTSAVGAIPLVVSRVHFGTSGRYNNAFWFNNQMSYGDGDGTNFTPLTTVDICGHEMTHGVIERTANLTYASESGAINEGVADIFGAMVELFADGGSATADTWKIGEDAYTPSIPGDALRRMDNPNAVGDPDHYTVRLYQGACTPSGSNDYCGVHTNSSIINHAFYLMAAGGTNRVSGVTVTGTGTSDAARIWYRALTTYMTASTNFAAARTATLNSATDLFGATSPQFTAVAAGWCAVGVGTCPGGSTPTPTPTPTPGGTNLLVNGDFEGSITPWVRSGTGSFYQATGSGAQSGTGYVYFGTANNRTGQAYQTVTIPSTATGTMTFWLNVTSNETTPTTQFDRLFVEVRNTSGTLLATPATFSNLNKVTSATAYTQRSVNLSAYRGQTVRIQFRATTDNSLPTTFRVDNAFLQ